MSRQRSDYEIGYGKPPKHSQWKKGQCGNPKRQYSTPPKGTVELIDAQFKRQIPIVENGVPRRVSVLEAVILQLWRKEMAGDKRATRVRLKFQELASRLAGPREICVEDFAFGEDYWPGWRT